MSRTEIEPDLLVALLSDQYSLTGRLSRLAGESDNFLVETGDERYVLKLCTDAQSSETIDLEHLAVEALARADLGLELPRIVPTRNGGVEAVLETAGVLLRGRLLRFVDGVFWQDAGVAGEGRLREAGRYVARIVTALETVDNPAARRTHPWDLTRAAEHRGAVDLVGDPVRRQVLDRAYTLFGGAEPLLAGMPHSLIHGDLNDENVLVRGDRLAGVLDFGDCLRNPTICELAIALSYLLLEQPEPLRSGAWIVAGYHEERPLSVHEVEVLFPLMCGRLAVSVSIAAERRRLDPERSAWFVTEDKAWRALERYVDVDPLAAAEGLARAVECGS